VENITHELQQQKAERLGRTGNSQLTPSEKSSGTPSLPDEDGRSTSSFQTEGFLHTSQIDTPSSGSGEEKLKPRRTKVQLWTELKISCELPRMYLLISSLA
jgi:peroxin-3